MFRKKKNGAAAQNAGSAHEGPSAALALAERGLDYAALTREIEDETQAKMDLLISSLAEAFGHDAAHDQADEPKTSRDCDENLTALICLRVTAAIPLIRGGKADLRPQLEEDIDDLIKKAAAIEYQPKWTDDVIDHLADLLWALSPGEREETETVLQKRYRHRPKRQKKFSSEMFALFTTVAGAFQRLNKPEAASAVMEGLCLISRERNAQAMHREVISRVLPAVCAYDPETTVRIADPDRDRFAQTTDADSGDFFWFYAYALRMLGKQPEAVAAFDTCRRIREPVFGKDHWYTVIAERESCMLRYTSAPGEPEFSFLLGFVSDIENGRFSDVDEEQLLLIEGETLYPLLMQKAGVNELRQLAPFVDRYAELCERFDGSSDPLIKKRLAYNIQGSLYTEQGNYILAEEAFQNAINAEIPDGVPDIVTAAQIKTNLLLAYYAQNDADMAMPLISELFGILDDEAALEASGLTEKDKLRIYTLSVGVEAQKLNEAPEDGRKDLRNILKTYCGDILRSFSGISALVPVLSAFICSAVGLILQENCAEEKELRLYLDALEYIIREDPELSRNSLRWSILHHTVCRLAWTLGDENCAQYFNRTLALLNGDPAIPPSIQIVLLLSCSAFYAGQGETAAAAACIRRATDQIQSVWQSCVKYMNDNRLIRFLLPGQLQFSYAYTVHRTLADTHSAYESVLRFKALASLAGKERNRILHSAHVDPGLLDEIHAAQDRLAALETESQFRDITNDYETEQKALRTLETQFAREFPADSAFLDITCDHVLQAVPDDSVLVEYYYCAFSYKPLPSDCAPERPAAGFDIFIIQKRGGRCTLEKITVADTDDLLAAADTFVALLQESSFGEAAPSKVNLINDLRTSLYRAFISPILPYLEGFETVYIAPDSNFVNLPIEILYDKEQECLTDRRTVIKIECARDFLYKRAITDTVDGSLVIGDPQFDLRDGEAGERNGEPEGKRFGRLDAGEITRLPCSHIEAEQTGKHLHCDYYTGAAASKQLLLHGGGYKNLHIATHGYFDASESDSDMYASCLLFAGVVNWLKDGKTSSVYGNGLVTADEISRLDFNNVELAVLASCMVGMSDETFNKGFQGMIGAFSAAGVHYVISHLWAANDFSTAVLMDAFYLQYAEKHMPPPIALQLAKTYLRNVTVGELKKQHWFDRLRRLDPEKKYLRDELSIESRSDTFMPFKNEAYWGGFTCYQCY